MLKTIALVLVVGLAGAADTIPLPLELPKPKFTGTPKNIVSKRLEPARTGARPALQVPAGTTLLSRGAAVTASDMEPVVGELTYVTDGEKEADGGTFVELGPKPQWVQIDLGKPAAIAAIVAWHVHSEARVYRDVIVQIADDAEFKTNVRTLFNNDDDDSSKQGAGKDLEYVENNEGKLIDAKGAVARYVRLWSNGNTANDMNHYTEVEVFGTAK